MGSALQDADVLVGNPKITDYHFEPADKILLFKRPVVTMDRTLVSPLAEIKDPPVQELPSKGKIEKKKKKEQSPDNNSSIKASGAIDVQDKDYARNFKTI